MISLIDHIVLTIADIERSVAFYQRVLLMDEITFAQGCKALKFGNQKINLQALGKSLEMKLKWDLAICALLLIEP